MAMAMVHSSRLLAILLFSLPLLLLLLLLAARPSAADGSSTYPADCPYPCLPPPAVTANCPPPPSSYSYSYPPPPSSSSYSYPPPPPSSYSTPPPPGGYIPYPFYQPPAGGGGGGGYGYPAPPPPNPILPWYPWYYKTPSSSSARGTSTVLWAAASLAAGLLIIA